jgi:hypothetical protein
MSETKTLEEHAIDVERARRNATIVCDAEARPPHPPLVALTLAELFERPAPQYLIDQLIPERSLLEVVGAPGTFKTFVMASAGLSIASGQPEFFGYPITKHGPVLAIVAEGAGSYPHRVRVWCDEHGVDPLTIPFRVIPIPVNLRDPSFQQELLTIVEEMRPVLLIVDTRSRCTPGAEENSAKDMGEVIGFFSELQTPSGCAIASVHHPTKSDPTGGGRGSGVFFGAMDTEFRITTDDDSADVQGSRAITVTCTKQKDDLAPPPLKLVGHVVPVRNADGYALIHESGRPITSIVLRLAGHSDVVEHAQKAAAADREIDLKVLATMNKYPAATSQSKLRVYAELNQNDVATAVGRILRAGWAVEGKRGQPYTLTDLGNKQLETEL